MITIEVIGMNHYMLSDYSHMHTKQIANLFETDEDEVFFHSGDLKLFHEGVDQTSWHALVRVHAPKKYEPFEKNVAKYLLDTLTDYILNAHLEFVYIDESHTYEKLNHDYAMFFPREESEEDYEEDYEDDEDFSDEELFEGNAFEGFEEKLKARQAAQSEEKMCECGHQHVCCNGRSPACGKICVCGERCMKTCHHAHNHECCEDDDCDCSCNHEHHHKH